MLKQFSRWWKLYNECAVDADALGFMAKMLVQTTSLTGRSPGKQYTRTDGDVILSITDSGGCRAPLWGVS